MTADLSKSACRCRLQTGFCGYIVNGVVVSDKGKGTLEKCQVRFMKTNANEPSIRLRYQIRVVKTGVLLLCWDK